MKRRDHNRLLILSVLILSTVLSGCLKDKCSQTYTLYSPVYQSLSAVRAGMKSVPARDLQTPGRFTVYNNYLLINERDKGIHIIDNTVPAAPRNISFLRIPGNLDLAIKGNILYADSYGDLITFDISDPKNIKRGKILQDVFPHRNAYLVNVSHPNPDSVQVIVDWAPRDTIADCETFAYLSQHYYEKVQADSKGNFGTPGLGGRTGSIARFTLLNDHLYTATNQYLNVFDVSHASMPAFVSNQQIGWNIESLFPFRNNLFIGSTTGLFIYSIIQPESPAEQGKFANVRSCDQIVANEELAFITRRANTFCGGTENKLEIVGVKNANAPTLQRSYPLVNPYGLSIDENLLFVCDGKDGLKIFQVINANELKLVKHVTGLMPFDVIAGRNQAIVLATDGIYQFNYLSTTNIQLVSKIPVMR